MRLLSPASPRGGALGRRGPPPSGGGLAACWARKPPGSFSTNGGAALAVPPPRCFSFGRLTLLPPVTPLLTPTSATSQSEVEETIERIKVQAGVEGYVICNKAGLVLRRFPSMPQDVADMYAESMRTLATKVRIAFGQAELAGGAAACSAAPAPAACGRRCHQARHGPRSAGKAAAQGRLSQKGRAAPPQRCAAAAAAAAAAAPAQRHRQWRRRKAAAAAARAGRY